MRLYLSSFQLGDRPEKLMELTGGGDRALVIANACNLLDAPQRLPRVEREFADLGGLGFRAEELDLRDYFIGSPAAGDPAGLAARLAACDLVWARGGNPFVLRRAMRQSGFDDLIAGLLRRDALVYGGYSGGIAVLTPTLRGVDLIEEADPEAVPGGYDPAILWDGLGLVPYALAPHYRSDHPASADMDKAIAYFAGQGLPYRTLRDGEALVVDGDREEIVK